MAGLADCQTAENEGVAVRLSQFFGLTDTAAHPLDARRQYDFSPQGVDNFLPLQTHRIGQHGQNETQALDGGGHGQTDARIAARRFDDDRVLGDLPGLDPSSIMATATRSRGRCPKD